MASGVLLVAHGSHLSPNSSAPVHAHRQRLIERGDFDEVRTAFWREEPSLARGLEGCESDDITIVPVLISAGYFVTEVIPREMRLTGRVTVIDGKCVRYADPIGAHPALASVILERAAEAGAGPTDALAVLGHGTPRNPQSERNIYRQAEWVGELAPAREVTTVFLDQEPNMRRVFSLVAGRSVVMVPLFVADGWHVGTTIPDDLSPTTEEAGHDGRRLRYSAAVGTHPRVADVIAEMVGEARRW